MVNNRVKKKKILTNNRPALRLYINNVRQKERRTGVPYISTLRFWKIPMTKDIVIQQSHAIGAEKFTMPSCCHFEIFQISEYKTSIRSSNFTMSAESAKSATAFSV